MPVLDEDELVDTSTGEIIVPRGTPHERREKFVELYLDPSSPSHRNASKSYLLMSRHFGQEVSETSAGRSSVRYMAREDVRALLDAKMAHIGRVFAFSATDYVKRCLEREAMLAERGGRGDSQAAVSYMKLAGTALGYLVQRTEDMTPAERKVIPLEEQHRLIIEAGQRLARLAADNPLPEQKRLASAEVIEVEVVEPEGTN